MAAFSSSRVDDLGRQELPAYRACKHHGDGPLIILAFAVDLFGTTGCHIVAAARRHADTCLVAVDNQTPGNSVFANCLFYSLAE